MKDFFKRFFSAHSVVPSPPPRGHMKAREARCLAEKSSEELKVLLKQIRKTAAKGETSLWLKGYCKEIGDDLQVRKLLEGLNYGLNKSGTVDGALVIYW